MPAYRGLFHFPGISKILRGQFVFAQGISPGVATLEIAPQFIDTNALRGTLSITYEQDGFIETNIEFPDCVIESGSYRVSDQGHIFSLKILDRRWKWKYPTIDGWYNKRLDDGDIFKSVSVDTEKTPRELMTLLLEAMGETNFDLSDVPDTERPEVKWVVANAANELASLCDKLGCRVVLRRNNRVKICRTGVGLPIPTGRLQNADKGVNRGTRPDKLVVMCGPSQWQSRLKVEAVGEETDGRIRPVNDLSYLRNLPFNWSFENPDSFVNIQDKDVRRLALSCVYRWYRIIENAAGYIVQADGSDTVPGDDNWQVHRWQILPISDELLTTVADADGLRIPKRARAYGEFYDGRLLFDGNSLPGSPVDRNMKRHGFSEANRIGNSFKNDRGIVEFAEAIYRIQFQVLQLWSYLPANLVLETKYSILCKDTRIAKRYSKELDLPLPHANTKPHVIRREDLFLTTIVEYDARGAIVSTTTNKDELDAKLDEILQIASRDYVPYETYDVTYARIMDLDLDGHRAQIAWSVGDTGATTRISLNSDFHTSYPTYENRRLTEELLQQTRDKRAVIDRLNQI